MNLIATDKDELFRKLSNDGFNIAPNFDGTTQRSGAQWLISTRYELTTGREVEKVKWGDHSNPSINGSWSSQHDDQLTVEELHEFARIVEEDEKKVLAEKKQVQDEVAESVLELLKRLIAANAD